MQLDVEGSTLLKMKSTQCVCFIEQPKLYKGQREHKSHDEITNLP